ncbi:MAG: ABC-F type ribosomal protection protein [Chloroflexi bacterium]|nr:ABC-F type ribosomal protection protein [Chloroflexota bacterium]
MFLSVTHLSKSYGTQPVLNDAALTLGPGQRVGLVGANGVGKSTLLKIIMGEIEADSGEIVRTPDIQIGYLAQVLGGDNQQTLAQMIDTALRHVRALETRLRALEAALADAPSDSPRLLEYGEALEQFERYGGYEIEARLAEVLAGLRIGHLSLERRFATLSGGEKSRMGLALLLLQAPDVLLLDEPTNHLDFATLEWLETYLQRYRGGILIVSHDRQFLNRTVNAIVEIDEHTRQTKRYSGSYDAYYAAKQHERQKWQMAWAAQQDEIAELRHEIKVEAHQVAKNYPTKKVGGDKFARGFFKGRTAVAVSRRVRNAEERLARIEADPIPMPPKALVFDADFDAAALHGRYPLSVSGLRKAYDGRCILDDVSFELALHSRIVIVGPNGAGKSTLLKILVGAEQADSGTLYWHPGVKIGYLDQEHATLDTQKTLFEAYAAGLAGQEQALKAILLHSGLFRYEEFERRVSALSSGQRRKLQIGRLIAGQANLLVLDEPTNFVSFDILEGLEEALRQFPGPIIAATHDRRFMQSFGGEIWALEAGRLVKYLGGYEDYLASSSAS